MFWTPQIVIGETQETGKLWREEEDLRFFHISLVTYTSKRHDPLWTIALINFKHIPIVSSEKWMQTERTALHLSKIIWFFEVLKHEILKYFLCFVSLVLVLS